MKFDIEKLRPAKVKIVKSKTGLGLVAMEPLKKGQFVIEYTGKKLTAKEANIVGGKYLFEISSKVTIDGKDRKNIARYINHSCEPNCEVETKKDRIFIFTIKKVKKGEELSFDYGKEYFDEFLKPIGCKCGAERHLYDTVDKKEMIKILKEGGVGVIPTDTIYGVVARAQDEKAVERIYKIKGRDENKPFIILISKISDLKKFGISKQFLLSQKKFTFWPGPVSVILEPKDKITANKFKYLNRGLESPFRLPKKKSLIEILKKTGPLVAPSANPQGLPPAKNIQEARKYFENKVDFYFGKGDLKANPSTLIKIEKNGEIKVLRGILKNNVKRKKGGK